MAKAGSEVQENLLVSFIYYEIIQDKKVLREEMAMDKKPFLDV